MDDAGGTGSGELTEAGVDLVAGGIETGGRIKAGELGVIEHIIEFAAELDEPIFRAEREVFEDGDVPGVDAGAAEDVFRSVAEIAAGGAGENGGVEPAGEGLLAGGERGGAADVDAVAVAAAGDVGVIDGREADAGGEAGGHGGEAGDLPAIKDQAGGGVTG